MNIYRIRTGKKLFSFQDPILELPVMDHNLKSFQENAILKTQLKLIEVSDLSHITDESYFYFEDDLLFTSSFVQEVKNLSEASERSLEFYLNENTFNTRYMLNTSVPSNFRFVKNKSQSFKKTLVHQNVFENFIQVPSQIIPGGQYHFDQCEIWITRMASPFHLLYANLALNFGRSLPAQKLLPKWLRDFFFPIGSKPFFWILKRMNKIGKGCKIHPSAILEGVELGDNVTIGANCVVRLSKVGSGTTLEDNVILNYSVIGKNNYFSANNFINVCMTYEHVFLIHGPYQFSIYGKGVAVMAVINCDIRLDNKNIVIPSDTGLIDSKQSLLGIAYGHGSVVGGGNIIAPGRIVPNNLKIAPPSDTIITKFDQYENK